MIQMVYITIASSLICFILYAIDRRLRGESLDWMTAVKITSVGSLLSGGIAYAVSSPEVIEVVNTVADIPMTQEMFVGVPTF